MKVVDIFGFFVACALVVLLFWGTLSVWSSELMRIKHKCDEVSSNYLPLKIDLFCE
jgi:hypothetical protein